MLALLVGGIVTIAVLGSQTSWFQDWLRRYVVREANDAMNGELAIGRLRGNLVTGVTLSDLAIRQHGAVVVRADEAQVTYDIRDFLSRAIVLRHVLEHLPDPLAAMAIFRTLLAPGGHVLLEFPNIDGIDFRVKRWLHRTGLHRRRWPSDYRPGHCNEYDLPSFRHLADRTGFDLRAWETYSSGPVRNQLLRHWPVGTKARALIRKK